MILRLNYFLYCFILLQRKLAAIIKESLLIIEATSTLLSRLKPQPFVSKFQLALKRLIKR